MGKERRDGKNTYRVLEAGRRWCEKYRPVSTGAMKKKNKKENALRASSAILKVTREDLHLAKYCNPVGSKKFREQLLMVMYICIRETGIRFFSVADLIALFANLFQEKVSSRKVYYAINHGEREFEGRNKKKAIYHTLTRDGIEEAERLIARYRTAKAKNR